MKEFIQDFRMVCKSCGKDIDCSRRYVISQLVHPFEVEGVMDGWYFEATCPSCGTVHEFDIPVSYCDEKNGYMVFSCADCDRLYKAFLRDYTDNQNVNERFMFTYPDLVAFRLVKNKEQLVEKMKINYADLDDRVIEAIKWEISQITNDLFEGPITLWFETYNDDEILLETRIPYESDLEIRGATCHIPMDFYDGLKACMDREIDAPLRYEIDQDFAQWFFDQVKPDEKLRLQKLGKHAFDAARMNR